MDPGHQHKYVRRNRIRSAIYSHERFIVVKLRKRRELYDDEVFSDSSTDNDVSYDSDLDSVSLEAEQYTDDSYETSESGFVDEEQMSTNSERMSEVESTNSGPMEESERVSD